nr:FIST N-terminal domain-containing protein [Thiothrix subterranea]
MHLTPAQIFVDQSGSCEGLLQSLDKAIAAGAQSVLVFAADANGFTPAQLDTYLQALPIPIFGGIFPEIIANGQILQQGSVVCALPIVSEVYHIEHLSDPDADYFSAIEALSALTPANATLVTLVDGLSKRIGSLLESLYEIFGGHYQYIGGGAGSLSFEQKPCLFSNQGLRMDCAQITCIQLPLSTGIEHGWRKFAGPFFVTGAYNNTITTLDYQPAFEVYRKVVEADSGKRFADGTFFDLAKAYPFGLERLSSDVVVRDPLFVDGNKLICVEKSPPITLFTSSKARRMTCWQHHALALPPPSACQRPSIGIIVRLHQPHLVFTRPVCGRDRQYPRAFACRSAVDRGVILGRNRRCGQHLFGIF